MMSPRAPREAVLARGSDRFRPSAFDQLGQFLARQAPWLLGAALVAAPTCAWSDIVPGASRDQVIAELGYPDAKTQIGDTETLNYKGGIRIIMKRGQVAEMSKRGQIGVSRNIPYRSPTALRLDQGEASGPLDLRDRSDHQQCVQQGGKTPVLTTQDEARGAVLRFDGQDAFLRVAESPGLDLEEGMTLCAWIKPDLLTQQMPVLEWERNGAHLWVNAKGYQWGTRPTGVNLCIPGDKSRTNGSEGVVSTTNPEPGRWTHLAVTYDASTRECALLINGELKSRKTVPAGRALTQGDLIIGARPGLHGDGRFSGLMDDLRVIRRALAPEEIAALMGPIPREPPKSLAANAAPRPGEEAAPDILVRAREASPGNPGPAPRPAAAPKSRKAASLPANPSQILGTLGTILTQVHRIAVGLSLLLGAAVLAAYIFGCYCYKLICEKAGQKPGALIWIPVAQFLPLLRVAQMPDWMLVLLLVPVVNIGVMIVLWAKICEARNKSPWLAATLLVPILNLVLIPYLAFSSGVPATTELKYP